MSKAIELAKKGVNSNAGGPFGAVIVKNGKIIAEGYNKVTSKNDPTAHAEMIALTAAFNALGSKYLSDATLYVTVEPCGMCVGCDIVFTAIVTHDAAFNFPPR